MERRERASVTMGAPRWRLPRVGLGTGLHGGVSERQSVTTIEHALECGVRHPLDDVHHRLTIPTS